MEHIGKRLINWASIPESAARDQALRTASHFALLNRGVKGVRGE